MQIVGSLLSNLIFLVIYDSGSDSAEWRSRDAFYNQEIVPAILHTFLDNSGNRNGGLFLYESEILGFETRGVIVALSEEKIGADKLEGAITAIIEGDHMAFKTVEFVAFRRSPSSPRRPERHS